LGGRCVQDSRSRCLYRIAAEGMPLLLPAMTRQLLTLAAADLLRLLSEGSLALPDTHRLPLHSAHVRAPCARTQVKMLDGLWPLFANFDGVATLHVCTQREEGVCILQEGPAAAANGAAAKGEAEEPPAKKAKTVRGLHLCSTTALLASTHEPQGLAVAMHVRAWLSLPQFLAGASAGRARTPERAGSAAAAGGHPGRLLRVHAAVRWPSPNSLWRTMMLILHVCIFGTVINYASQSHRGDRARGC
jgi:hypothetical protein